MSLINRHGPCVGIKLFSYGQRFVQLWYIPPGYTIEPHSHDDEDIELMYLCGKTVFFKDKGGDPIVVIPERFKPRWYHIFRKFTVKAGTVHWFSTTNTPLIFINFSKFLPGNKPRSAAKDFNIH